ncbi:MAG: M6 family metalloprotease domain-containing protein, partial [Deltaproteobacteria bacterium]|nr:M6 family metalloprotease domain-containing protein [Deltaproteobacteria bacterium]
TWSKKIFSASDGNLNHYLNETTYGKYQFSPANESSGCTNDGFVTVTMNENHPNTQNEDPDFDRERYACYAEKAIRKADDYVNFSQYDTDNNTFLSADELQVMFLVAGGESASGINSPGGVWAMATSLYCDKDGDNSTISDGEYWVKMDSVKFMGSTTNSMNGYSQFGERHGDNESSNWDATIGVIAHELGHAYFDLPDLYCTDESGCEGIGKFGLMGGGAWGKQSSSEKSGATPVHMTAWTKKKISACNLTRADNGTNSYTLPAVYRTSSFSSTCPIYKVDNDTNDTEYFLVENRSKGGYDSGFYGLLDGNTQYSVGSGYSGGILIWHFQDILSSCLSNNNCQTGSTKLLDLEEANHADLDSGGSTGRTTHLYYSGNNSTFNNSSNPSSKWNDNSSSGISITNISAAGDDMTITVSK